MYNFQSRKGAHMLAIFLKPTDQPYINDGKRTLPSRSGYNRHRFAHTKRNAYSDMGGRVNYPAELGPL